MAWDKLTASRRNSIIPLVCLSLVWIALVVVAARLVNFDEPYLPFAIGGIAAFFLRARLSRWEVYVWLLSSALLVKAIHLPQVPFWVLRVAAAFALLGFGALLLFGLRTAWSDREGQENAVALLLPSLILIFFIFGCARMLQYMSGLNPLTDDAWLYAFDGSLGFQPSFAVGRVMYDSAFLTRSALLTYLSLPFAMAVVCAWQIPRAAKQISWHMLTVILLAGACGGLFYNIVPGTGPIYAFAQDFPWKNLPYRDLASFPLQKMPIALGIPRNAMPSLHVGWVVLLCWNARRFPRILRAALALYLVFTVIATLGGGQHYLVDLVVSLPFVLMVQSGALCIASLTTPGAASRRIDTRPLTGVAVGLVFVLSWLAMIRFGVPIVLKSPAIPWTFVLATIITTLVLEWRLSVLSHDPATSEVSSKDWASGDLVASSDHG
jgi:PAP2 superfamily